MQAFEEAHVTSKISCEGLARLYTKEYCVANSTRITTALLKLWHINIPACQNQTGMWKTKTVHLVLIAR